MNSEYISKECGWYLRLETEWEHVRGINKEEKHSEDWGLKPSSFRDQEEWPAKD